MALEWRLNGRPPTARARPDANHRYNAVAPVSLSSLLLFLCVFFLQNLISDGWGHRLNGELHLSPLTKPRRILDVGTGTGLCSPARSKCNWNPTDCVCEGVWASDMA